MDGKNMNITLLIIEQSLAQLAHSVLKERLVLIFIIKKKSEFYLKIFNANYFDTLQEIGF